MTHADGPAQRPCGRAAGTVSRLETLTTRIPVAAALGPRDGTDTEDGTLRSLSPSKGRTQRISRRFDKLSDRMVEPAVTVSRFEKPSIRIPVAAALSPRDATGALRGTPPSLCLSTGRTQRISRRFDKLSDRMVEPAGTVSRFEGQPPASPSLRLLVRGTEPTRRTAHYGP